MVRRAKKPRRLAVGVDTYLWSVRHAHGPVTRDAAGAFVRLGDDACRETLALRPLGRAGGLRIEFRGGPGRLVPDGWLPSGTVGTDLDALLNLHEPGTVRALLDEALADGWDPDHPRVAFVDGWTLFDGARTRRGAGAAG
jgi:hypothetical protein